MCSTVLSATVFYFLLLQSITSYASAKKTNMVISSSSQQQGLKNDDASGYRTGQNLDVAVAPPPNVIRLWQEVALGIDRSQTGKNQLASGKRACILGGSLL